jgi:hypothetical protein
MGIILADLITFVTIPRQGKAHFPEVGLIVLVAFLSEVISEIGYTVFKQSMNISANIYQMLNLPLIVLLYRRQIHWKNKNAIAATIISLFAVYALSNFFFIQGVHTYNSFTSAFSAGCAIIISITYFYILIQELPTQSITKLPMFWINSAILIYRAGTFFVYLSADYLITVLKDNMIATLFVHHLLGFIYYSMICYAMLLIRREYLPQGQHHIGS